MKFSILVKPEAEIDFREASSWYEDQKQGLGFEFLDAVEEKIFLVAENPYKYQVRFRNTRFATLRKFPFAIHFTIDSEVINILAVLSTYRNPQIWN